MLGEAGESARGGERVVALLFGWDVGDTGGRARYRRLPDAVAMNIFHPSRTLVAGWAGGKGEGGGGDQAWSWCWLYTCFPPALDSTSSIPVFRFYYSWLFRYGGQCEAQGSRIERRKKSIDSACLKYISKSSEAGSSLPLTPRRTLDTNRITPFTTDRSRQPVQHSTYTNDNLTSRIPPYNEKPTLEC